MSDANGSKTATSTATVPPAPKETPPYRRPEADRNKVYETVERSLGEIVSEAAHQAAMFVHAAREYRGDPTAVRYAHLVDAAECMEIGLTHLGLLKSAVAFRLRTEDDQNITSDTMQAF